MSSRFKCLIELNNYKYSVYINSNNNFITFANVFNEIQNQIKQNISYETHLFEIFDIDFKEYVLISSDKQIIDNLSRIRVSEKTINNKSIGIWSIDETQSTQSTQQSIKSNTSSNSLGVTPIQTKTKPFNNENNTNTKFLELNKFSVHNINDKTNSTSTQLRVSAQNFLSNKKVENNSNIETVAKPFKPQFIPNESEQFANHTKHITNYLGHKFAQFDQSFTNYQLKYETTVEKIGNNLINVLKFSYNDIKAFSLLVHLMTINVDFFKINSSNVLTLNKKWEIVSDLMIKYNYKEWSPQKCRDSFFGAIHLYKEFLSTAPNYWIASAVYPLFELIHSLDLKYFVETENLNKIIELRQKFVLKTCGISDFESNPIKSDNLIEVNSNTDGSQFIDQTLASTSKDTNPFRINECNLKLREQYFDIDLKAVNSSKSSIEGSTQVIKPVIINYFGRVIPECQQANRFHIKYETTVEKIGNNSTIVLKFCSDHIKAFNLLLQLMTKNIKLFETYSSNDLNLNNKWAIISDEMKRNGYEEWNAQKCRDSFFGVIARYKQILENTSNYSIASVIYPFFESIHSLELKYFLNNKHLNKVLQLRQVFEQIPRRFNETIQSNSKDTNLFQTNQCNHKLRGEYIYVRVENSVNSNIESIADANKPLVINYFGPHIPHCDQSNKYQINYMTTIRKIGNDSTIVLKFSSDNMKNFNILVQTMIKSISVFEIDSSNEITENNKWTTVSQQMIRNGYEDWVPQKCRDSFFIAINQYKQILENTPNYKIASAVYPFFELIHSMDLKCFLRTKNFNRITELRKKFDLKTSGIKDFQSNPIQTNTLIEAKSDKNDKKSVIQTLASNLKDIQLNDSNSVDKNFAKTKEELNNFRSELQTKSKICKLTDSDIKAFHSMVQIIDLVITLFRRNDHNFWHFVSNQMIQNGYQEFDSKKCENIFHNYVCDNYKLVLICCSDFKTASAIYPLFGLIHSMNLKKSLSNKAFKKINKLREDFNIKCKQNKRLAV